MDCILAQCHPQLGELGDDFLHVVLTLYTSLLREVKAPGYTYDMITPGRLYKQMREQQRGDSSAVGPARNALSHRSGPYTHPKMPPTQWMQKSQTRFAAMSRHFPKWGPPRTDAQVVAVPFGGQMINLAPAFGSVTPEEYARVAFYFNQEDGAKAAEEMEQRRVRAERRERNLRKARGNEMRRMAALDDGHYEAKLPPKIHFWSPKGTSKHI
ncbi:hypothetical protein EWM64_g10911 [Hericium alpestre]|uniref:Uncharacterized protein n=1 Tax=Hericium alpestre TaxID=135208 RepID=A0A4Y9ZET1_9AGAM|nr:hypothetical protein EWM64_g10911 [Hericium alpestre]